MGQLTIELLPQQEQTAFNLRRWEELLHDPTLAKIEGRIETDRHGQIIMSPPPGRQHGKYQYRIGSLLESLMGKGAIVTECPISTADGVRAADVAWVSPERDEAAGEQSLFTVAPEICVEVISPTNSRAEIRDKTTLYFDAGALEVWHCSSTGEMTFFAAGEAAALSASRLGPKFPRRIAWQR